MTPYTYHIPTEITLAPGCLATLGAKCAHLGEKPFVVTGRTAARATGLLDRILMLLPNAELFDAIPENPGTAICAEGAARCAMAGCDVVVAAGGGSALDAAKAIAMLARNGGAADDYFGSELFQDGALPLIAIPTTAGTGSEVTPYAVLVDAEGASKRTVAGKALFPRYALLDPDLCVTLPRDVTIATGLDALSQAMEGMLSKRATPIGDTLALEACRIVRHALPHAANDPGNLDARAAMLHAAMLSGIIIAHSGTTLVHGMGYYFTLRYTIAHGVANALLLPPVFRHNARHAPAKVAALAEAIGATGDDPGDAIAAALHTLYDELHFSPAGRDWGVQEEDLEAFAKDIHADTYRFKNQLGDFTVPEVEALFREAYRGR